MLRKHGMTDIIVKPLVQAIAARTFLILGASTLQFLQDTGRKALINEIAGVLGHHAKAILRHARPCPAPQLIDVLVELIGEALRPRCKLLANHQLQVSLQCALWPDFLVARRFVNERDDGCLGEATDQNFRMLRLSKLLRLKRSSLPGLNTKRGPNCHRKGPVFSFSSKIPCAKKLASGFSMSFSCFMWVMKRLPLIAKTKPSGTAPRQRENDAGLFNE